MPPEVLNEIIGLYAHEFTKSGKDFVSFFGKFLDYFEKNKVILATKLSMGALANVSIAFASFGMTNESELDSWSNIRQGAIRNLKDDSLQLESAESLVLILSSL